LLSVRTGGDGELFPMSAITEFAVAVAEPGFLVRLEMIGEQESRLVLSAIRPRTTRIAR